MPINEDILSAVVVRTLQELGLTTGEISQRQAERTYGNWFKNAVKAGRLHPARQGEGLNATKYFSLAEIKELRYQDTLTVNLK